MDYRVRKALGESGIFGGLSARFLDALAKLCAVREHRRRDVLFHEGDPGVALYLLLEGGVQLVKTSEDGGEVVVKTVFPGELFAEAVLLEQDAYPVTAQCVLDSKTCRIPREAVLRCLDDARFRDDFVRSLMQRLRFLTDRILYLTLYDAEERFFRFLADRYGERETCRLDMPKKSIAAAIGATPETLSRLRERLVAEGRIRWEGNRLTRLAPGGRARPSRRR